MKTLFRVLLAISLFAIAAGFVAEYGFALKPCVLCWYQRYAYMAAGGFSCIGLLVPSSLERYALIGVGVSFATNAFFAIYQVLVEQKLITLPTLCKGVEIDTLNQSFEDFQKQLKAAQDYVPCDQIPWDLFGVSMAGYNAIVTSTILLGLLIILRRSLKRGS